ncbi:uncharacterized protein LOC135251177 [Anguilla rostrata]|uniref:uncharacterized protein LOC135251177 n=1 Tax=Anguilla rostrata TaxID=7938 RepID=UPI0030CCDCCB
MTELSTDRRFHSLTQEQVQTLDQVLTAVIPIHGRGNFPTLEVKPKDIIHMVRDKLIEKGIKVRDVRLNGSTASHVLVKENGTSYKDLDIIFGVELPKQEDFQIIKDVVLRCLLDFLPRGVNKDKITALTMKEAYVQKMVKVFTEHDRWSLISLSNNSGKNVELKFVNSLRRQFEFSVDSFQIILDRMLESYLEAERRLGSQHERLEDRASVHQRTSQPRVVPAKLPSTSLDLDKPQSLDKDLVGRTDGASSSGDSSCCFAEVDMREEEPPHMTEEPVTETAHMEKVTDTKDMEEVTETKDMDEVTEMEQVAEMSALVPGPVSESQEEAELMAKKTEAEGKVVCVIENNMETSALKEQVPNEVSIEATISLNTIAQVHMENSTDIEPTDSHSVPLIKETTAEGQVTLKVLCVPPCQSCACLSEETQDTEYSLPPPAKKTYKNSQMVVLKHSSPKPPRKMSKKVATVISSPGKTNSPDELSVAGPILNLSEATSVESVPMVVDVTGPDTNHCKSPTSTPQHDNCQVKLLNIVNTINTAELQDNDTESLVEITCSSQNCEFLTQSFTITSKCNELGVTQLSDKGQYKQIPAVEVLPPSPQALELADEIPESAQLVPELTTVAPESVVQVPQRDTEVPEFTEHILESAPQVPDFTEDLLQSALQVPEFTEHILESAPQVPGFNVQVAVASSPETELPAHVHKPNTQTSNAPELDTQSLESNVDVPELAVQTQESVVLEPEPDVQVLESDVQEPQPDVQVLESVAQEPEPDIQVLESNVQEPETKVQVLKSVVQEPESNVQVLDCDVQEAVHDVPGLDSDFQVVEPVAQCEKLKMEAAPNIQETETTVPTRDLTAITVVAESMYGDFEQAMDHLRYRLIATRNPEEIRGGGLLKYSNLLVREFKPASETEIKTLERYMCSRFFIDFPDVNEQQRKIESYLRNHFIGEEKSKYDYLMTLRRVVNESTVCLMGHERRQTLNMITVLALKVLGEQNIIPNTTNVTCYYQPAPYMADHSFNNYYIAHGQPPLFYQPYPLHIHMQTGLV